MRGRLTSIVALAVAGSLLLGVSQASAAATLVFTATLTGANEVPPNASPGTGTATVTWDTAADTMKVEVTFSGLLSATTASHIHCCAPPGTNGTVATQTPSFSGFPLGVMSGTFSQTFDMTQASSYNAAFITAHGGTVAQAEADLLAGLQAGQAYLNIHTTNLPGGEIRGQLQTFTAVQLTRFTASKSGKNVRVRWRTGSDAQVLGFNVYSGTASRRTRVNQGLIPAASRVTGATYSWLDQRVHGSRYWLQIVRTDGSTSWYGPARVH